MPPLAYRVDNVSLDLVGVVANLLSDDTLSIVAGLKAEILVDNAPEVASSCPVVLVVQILRPR